MKQIILKHAAINKMYFDYTFYVKLENKNLPALKLNAESFLKDKFYKQFDCTFHLLVDNKLKEIIIYNILIQ